MWTGCPRPAARCCCSAGAHTAGSWGAGLLRGVVQGAAGRHPAALLRRRRRRSPPAEPVAVPCVHLPLPASLRPCFCAPLAGSCRAVSPQRELPLRQPRQVKPPRSPPTHTAHRRCPPTSSSLLVRVHLPPPPSAGPPASPTPRSPCRLLPASSASQSTWQSTRWACCQA